jgi:hypothetical protein
MISLKLKSLCSLLVGGGVLFAGLTSCNHQALRLDTDAAIDGATPRVYFPSITAENLNRVAVTIPDDLAGSPALILMAYKRNQQTNVNTWLGHIDRMESQIPGLRVLETPTISSRRWGWMAGFIDGGMRSGIPDLEARERTVTLYTDVGDLNTALGIESVRTIYAVLLADDGRVLAIEPGDYSDEKLARLIRSME